MNVLCGQKIAIERCILFGTMWIAWLAPESSSFVIEISLSTSIWLVEFENEK